LVHAKACSFCGKKGHLEASCWEKQAICHKPIISEEEWKEDFSNPTTNSEAHGRKGLSQAVHTNNKNFFHHCKLSGHWEAKCWQLHPELHPRNHTTKRRVWRVKIEEDEELPASPIQGEEVVQGEIATQEVCITNKMDNRLMPREATFQWLFLYCIKRIPS
jgi:hypothetical protein